MLYEQGRMNIMATTMNLDHPLRERTISSRVSTPSTGCRRTIHLTSSWRRGDRVELLDLFEHSYLDLIHMSLPRPAGAKNL